MGEELSETHGTGGIETSPSYWTPSKQTSKRNYTCEEAVIIAMHQLPLPPRRASVNATLVRYMCPFDDRSHTLVTLAVESVRHLGVLGSNSLYQLAANVVWGRDGDHTGRNFKESVTV